MVKKTEYESTVNWLKDQNFTNYSYTFEAEYADPTTEEKIFKSGTIYPHVSSLAVGIVFYDVDVTDGNAVGTLLVHGNVLKERLEEINGKLDKETIEALQLLGIYVYSDNTLVSEQSE